jgi:Cdc6-like AAA superfamily ATPase
LNNLKSAIKNHIESEEPYSLLITGGWGAGKTYYVKNELIKYVKSNEIKGNRPIPPHPKQAKYP